MNITREADVLRAVLDLLQAHHVVAFRLNTGVVMAEYKGKSRPIKFGVPGMADILALPTVTGYLHGLPCSWCSPWMLEIKSAAGKQSAEQRSFQRQVEDAGAGYFLIRTPEQLEALLRRHGVSK